MAPTNADILDEVLIAHALRQMLWEHFGQASVPSMAIHQGGATLHVRGANHAYTVTITENPNPWFQLEGR